MSSLSSLWRWLRAVGLAPSASVEKRRQERHASTLAINEVLNADDRHHGRHLLLTRVTDQASITALTESEYRAISRALGTYNLLGLYVQQKYVNEKDVMAIWCQPILKAWRRAQPFIDYREQNEGDRPWLFFEDLANRAAAFSERNSRPHG